ncbi:hypothetical protein, partial [Citrobacter freundii]
SICVFPLNGKSILNIKKGKFLIFISTNPFTHFHYKAKQKTTNASNDKIYNHKNQNTNTLP